jgi:large subunit ribosomal protein L10
MAGPDTAAGAARLEKVAFVRQVRERLEGATATLLTEYRGLTVGDLASLRAELRKADAEYKVVKNTLTRIAARDAGLEVPDRLLTGPTAMAFCDGDPVAVAKVLRQFARDHPELVIKGGIFEGRLLDAGEAVKLADLASREELLAQLAGLMEAVVAQPARLAQASLSKAARLVAALQQQREAAGETTEGPAEHPAEPRAAAASPDREDAAAQPSEQV